MVFNKKAISPVVATALLLVVAVVAVVGFQTWFNTYQSGQFTKVEQQSNTGSAISVEMLQNDTVYIKNTGAIVTASSITAGTNCSASSVSLAANSVTPVTFNPNGGCIQPGTNTPVNVVVVTTDGVYTEKELVR